MPSRWLSELGFLIGQALMEALPLWMMVTLVQHNAGLLSGVSFTACWSLQLAAAGSAWTVRRLALRPVLTVLTLSAAGLSLVYAWQLLMPREPALWFLASYLCVRGLFLGLHAGKPGTVLRWFGLGTGFCVLLLAFIALSGTPRAALPYEALRSLAVAYLLLGALLAGFHQAGSSFTAPALLSVVVPTLVLLASSVLLVFGPQAAGWLVRSGAATLRQAASVAGAALSLLGTWLGSFLRWLGSLFEASSGALGPPGASSGSGETGSLLVRYKPIAWRMASSETLAVLLLLLCVLAVVHILASLARKRARESIADEPVHEEQHTTWSWQLLLQPLERLRRKQPAMPQPTAASPGGLRAIYRALLAWAAQQGQSRALSTTPSELAASLSAQLPSKRSAVSQLTDYYTKERYAEQPCTSAEQEHARTLMQELSQPLRSSPRGSDKTPRDP